MGGGGETPIHENNYFFPNKKAKKKNKYALSKIWPPSPNMGMQNLNGYLLNYASFLVPEFLQISQS